MVHLHGILFIYMHISDVYVYACSSSHVLQGEFPEGNIEVREPITKLSDDPPLHGVGPTG